MKNILHGRLNSKGLIKTLEVYQDSEHMTVNKIIIILDNGNEKMISGLTEKSFAKWLSNVVGIDYFKMPVTKFKLLPSKDLDETIISIHVKAILENEILNVDSFVNSLVYYMRTDKLVKSMSKVGVHINSADISSSLTSTTLRLDMDNAVYMKYVSASENDPEILMYSHENLESVLTNLLKDSNIEVPECMLVDEIVSPNSISITYQFEPGTYDETVLKMFDYLTINDFDDNNGEHAEDLFMNINECETTFETNDGGDNFKNSCPELEFITNIFKSLKMDIEMDAEEIEVETEYGASNKSKITFKGLKIRGRMN